MFRRTGREYRTQLGIKDGRPLELIQPGDTRFGTNFLMLQRHRECEGVLLSTVSNPRWDDSPWDWTPSTRVRLCKELTRPRLVVNYAAACTLLEPVYVLMKAMDKDGRTGMQVWSLGIMLEKRMVVLPSDCETREFVTVKVKDRARMMVLPVHAAAWMLHPLHRSARLFNDLAYEDITNTLTHFASVHPKNSKEYKDCWNSLKSFHYMDPEWNGKNSEEALAGDHVSMAHWWLSYGKKHPTLTKIAVKVLSMWTTASPCERNWSTFNLIHTRRRDPLSPNNLQMLVFIHWNKNFLRISKAKMGFVNTKQLEKETPEDEAPFDGFMRDREFDPAEVKRRAANWSKSRGRKSKGTRFDVRELQEERVDGGAWLLDLSYRPRRLADNDRGKTIVVDDEEEESHGSEGDGELLTMRFTNMWSTKRSGSRSCSTRHDNITPPPVLASGGCFDGGLADVHGDNAAVEVDADFGVCVDVPVLGTAEHANGDIGADMDDPILGTAKDVEAVGSDVFSTPYPGLRLGKRFDSLLNHVAPIAASGSNKDFREHLSAMSPMRTDFEEPTPDWARFTRPTPPALRLSEDIPTKAREGSQGIVYRRRTRAAEVGGPDPPQHVAARRASVSPPEIAASKVRRVRSLAGRKKGRRQRHRRQEVEEARDARQSHRRRP
ncbi:hypothetical protein CBR_g34079 [Chara braunii]|uniref:HAT C-terminal dimerisation domain-containing protein n=1 Tax=Chara braunii TaxID=69332 RepID=A0A388LHV0_CHABU|nr:hypothetical protein CBR_g34079 [Chara braunii]|eukprot:GBG81896.1 hypothetical protein CBR_g34079 [Chara braunii]